MEKQNPEHRELNPDGPKIGRIDPVGPESTQARSLTAEELELQQAAELPDREAMSLVNANLAAPINVALAANVLSDGSVAYANAVQNTPIDQSN